MTRRLDETYYAVLEKLSLLQNTLVAIRELAGMSQEEKEVFRSDSQSLVTEIDAQLDTFSQFDEQQERIESLRERIVTGRDRVSKLSGRLDVVRERVESWEKADRRWQEKTRRRLKVIWIITLVVTITFISIFVGAQYVRDPAVVLSESASKMQREHSTRIANMKGNSKTSAPVSEAVKAAMNRSRGGKKAVDGEILRALDEL
jgi:predicted nuclease with TOPRIM domain